MAKNALGQRQLRAHEKRRPINRVESDNIFADDMAVRGPPSASLTKIFPIMLAQTARTGHIVRQRVDPDVHDLRLTARRPPR